MCLRMGEDTQATISLSVNSLFISLTPPTIISLSWCLWVSHTVITGSISQKPSFSFNHLSALFVLPSCTYSVSSLVSPFSLHRFLSPSYWEAAILSYNLDNAECSLCMLLLLSVCMCVFLSLWGTGARTWLSSSLLPTWDRPAEEEKTSAAWAKQN